MKDIFVSLFFFQLVTSDFLARHLKSKFLRLSVYITLFVSVFALTFTYYLHSRPQNHFEVMQLETTSPSMAELD